jgi:hypothetical protein
MEEYNIEFFEEYTKLDRLCCDMYGCDKGITTYIQDMESNWQEGIKLVKEWRSVYKTLKKYRHIRNKFAHGEYSFHDEGICGEIDVKFLRFFYNVILEGKDPLALYRRMRKEIIKKPYTMNNTTTASNTIYNNRHYNKNYKYNQKKQDSTYIYVIITIIIIIFILYGIAMQFFI